VKLQAIIIIILVLLTLFYLFIYLFNFLQGGILVNILAPNGSIQFALLGRQWQQTRDTTYVARLLKIWHDMQKK